MAKIDISRIIENTEKNIDFKFNNKDLLILSLTHKSYPTQKKLDMVNNEKLELLGDSILNFIITDYIFKKYTSLSEGNLTKLRARLINSEILANVANRIKLSESVLLGKAAEISAGRKVSSILGDAVEALIGAIFLDSGILAAKKFVIRLFEPMIKEQFSLKSYSDFKSMLQEKTVKYFNIMPSYRIIREEGPVHDRTFYAEVNIPGHSIARGKGKTKKNAELEAARKALVNIEKMQKKD
jgi:ribonuclease-3